MLNQIMVIVGAPVFIPRTDTNGGSIPLGVLSGGSHGTLGIGRTMYFTSINNVTGTIQTGEILNEKYSKNYISNIDFVFIIDFCWFIASKNV